LRHPPIGVQSVGGGGQCIDREVDFGRVQALDLFVIKVSYEL